MRTTFDLSTSLLHKLNEARDKDRYTTRYRSQWICEAVIKLPELDPSLVTIGLSDDITTRDARASVTLTIAAMDVIDSIKHRIRREDPTAEGLRGQILRAAVRLRLSQRHAFPSSH